MPSELVLPDRTVPILLRRHPGARRIIMRVSPCGTALRLTVPDGVAAATVRAFLDRNRDWAAARLGQPRVESVSDGSVLPFRGGEFVVRHEPGCRATRLTADGVLVVGGQPEHVSRRVRDFLVRAAKDDLDAAVARHAQAVGIRPAGLSLKDTVSRWGSCSAARRLSFSWRIVMAPPHVLDYLAAHEVAHLREMNHGPDFWALCRELCPGMDEGRAWLKRHGGRLHAIDFAGRSPPL